MSYERFKQSIREEQRGTSCLCCGQVKPAAVWSEKDETIYVCADCRSAKDRLAALTAALSEDRAEDILVRLGDTGLAGWEDRPRVEFVRAMLADCRKAAHMEEAL